MKHVVMVSGGLVSWAVAEVVCNIEAHDDVVLLFADTLIEDPDLYRFLGETTQALGTPITYLADGRTPWEVFRDVKFIGNTRIDPCSRVLKREITRKWLEDNCDPEDTTVHIGFSWDEGHRFEKAVPFWSPWTVRAPLLKDYPWDRAEIHARLASYGIRPPALYAAGFPHNNCGGFCVKAGQAQFKLLLEQYPARYAYHEQQERLTQEAIGTDATILRDRRGGTTKPMSMQMFRERLVEEGKIDDEYDWGGCACFYPMEGP